MPRGEKLNPDFWGNVDVRGPDECWLWQRSRTKAGYGRLRKDGRYVYAHRHAYKIANGTLDETIFVCHSCDVPACCNPAHLWVGTAADNVHDAMNKGRRRKGRTYKPPYKNRNKPHLVSRDRKLPDGSRLPRKGEKLTPEIVIGLRQIHARGGITYVELARALGCGIQTVRQAILGHRWKSLEDTNKPPQLG